MKLKPLIDQLTELYEQIGDTDVLVGILKKNGYVDIWELGGIAFSLEKDAVMLYLDSSEDTIEDQINDLKRRIEKLESKNE